jgi:hypothetical protein
MRKFLVAVAVLAVLFANAEVARADRAGPSPVPERVMKAEVVVVGKVTGIEKEPVQALPYPGATAKAAYQIATVKIDTGLVGADKIKEVRVGFISRANAAVPRRGWNDFEFKEGQELVMFLSKHPAGDFHITTWMYPPLDPKTEEGKRDLETVKRIAAVIADPAKALKSDKPEVRAEAAAIVVLKYRQTTPFGGATEQVPIAAEESKMLLKALTEGNWSFQGSRYNLELNPYAAFQSLGLSDKDGWIPPVIVNTPGAPPVDFGAVQRDAFAKWLAGPGKDYIIKKIVPKAAK